ncbi:uncharacterized protein LOC125945605 isoform X3 [Dermacentor silvarum]|nr:uncharacterized protein LOC125945605 isoform X2 [Dermacentor silvarum]XP_049523654.1 uncharacterized protein LOC125945605 isoform X3 [Dermacentor silvarum]
MQWAAANRSSRGLYAVLYVIHRWYLPCIGQEWLFLSAAQCVFRSDGWTHIVASLPCMSVEAPSVHPLWESVACSAVTDSSAVVIPIAVSFGTLTWQSVACSKVHALIGNAVVTTCLLSRGINPPTEMDTALGCGNRFACAVVTWSLSGVSASRLSPPLNGGASFVRRRT